VFSGLIKEIDFHEGDCMYRSNWLNVVLHGLFVIHVKHDHIELLTPFVHEHVYYAGDWVTKVECLKNRPRLEAGQVYDLVGVNQFMHPPIISLNSNTVVSKSVCGCTVQDHHSYFKVRLPFPADIVPLRSHQYPGPIYAGKNAPQVAANGVSLCPVFVYPVADFDNVRLWGTNWEPDPWEATIEDKPSGMLVANLHLWAEPKIKLPASHGRHAYHALMHLLPPLELEPLIDDPPKVPDEDYPLLGLSRCELYGLSELKDGDTDCQQRYQTRQAARSPIKEQENDGGTGGDGGGNAGGYTNDELSFGSHVTNCQSITVV
jgi:hypothetical protein